MPDVPNPNPFTGPPDGPAEEQLLRAFDDLVTPGLSRPLPFAANAECPEPADWLRLASHGATAGEAESLLAHAALCTTCLARLRASQAVTSETISPDEAEEMEKLACSSPQWQHHLAVELAQSPRRGRNTRNVRLLVWAGSAVALTAILVLGLVSYWRFKNSPARLLAEAYTQARTFDLRIPGAGFAPVVLDEHLRGGNTGHESPDLLSARAAIERKLEESPADPYWLQLQARADLLAENYNAAIDILDRLLAAGPVTASLLTDDASAYFQRGVATGSENDRATALDDLRRADELAPGDPVVLFNEACVMEDRGQVMNAVETWNRYLEFERDPKWKEEGNRRLQALEMKLKKLRSHADRMQQHLATPQAMRALASDPATLAAVDEEFSTTLLPRLLDAAFPSPVDRSRGSPCGSRCAAARTLLDALAASLQRNHDDPWLHDLLAASLPLPSNDFLVAAHALGEGIDADTRGDYADAGQWSLKSRDLFHRIGNAAGEDRAEVERLYALQRSYTFATCHKESDALLARASRYTWIMADATTLNADCDLDPGTAAADNPFYEKGLDLARSSHYAILAMRAQAQVDSAAVEEGDTETAWRLCMRQIRGFYQGDYPPFRAATTMSGLAYIEDATPRTQLDDLVNREALHLFELTQNRSIIAWQRAGLIRAAIRAGNLKEAEAQIAIERKVDLATGSSEAKAVRAESDLDLAGLYLDRADLKDAARMLDDAHDQMIHEDNSLQLGNYAAERGELDLVLGHPETAEPLLRAAILREESEARGAGAENIVYARQNRELYATLAAVWLAQKRPALDILALWERYRLRILGEKVPACPAGRLDCLKPRIEQVLDGELATDRASLIGQIVLRDRVLLYHATAGSVGWSQIPAQQSYAVAAAGTMERVASSPATSEASVDQAARRAGAALVGNLLSSTKPDSLLLIEADPLLGNLPWAAVATVRGPIGIRFALEEAPSILLSDRDAGESHPQVASGPPLVIGASEGAGQSTLLPEALKEARTVAALETDSDLLLGRQATEPRVAARLDAASSIHFAGHATEFDGTTRLLLAPTGSPSDRPYLDRKLFLRDPPKEARLIVFSACATGKREEGWDHGMGDIVDTLALLGVPEVVSTHWQIDSASAASMMGSFYRGLAAGSTVPQALRSARQSLLHDARYRHPYYWAAYYASGVGDTDMREVFHGNSR